MGRRVRDPSGPKTTRPPAGARRPRVPVAERFHSSRTLDAQPDRIDLRDWLYQPTLSPLPTAVCHAGEVPFVLDQEREGACTGFALAAVIHLLQKRRGGEAPRRVSARMLYELARRYDEFPGESYEGATARGAMKAWVRHGVCGESLWPAAARGLARFDAEVAADARGLPGGAFYRVQLQQV